MLLKLAAIVAIVAGIIESTSIDSICIDCCPAFAGTRVAETYQQSKVLTQREEQNSSSFFSFHFPQNWMFQIAWQKEGKFPPYTNSIREPGYVSLYWGHPDAVGRTNWSTLQYCWMFFRNICRYMYFFHLPRTIHVSLYWGHPDAVDRTNWSTFGH